MWRESLIRVAWISLRNCRCEEYDDFSAFLLCGSATSLNDRASVPHHTGCSAGWVLGGILTLATDSLAFLQDNALVAVLLVPEAGTEV